MAVSGFASSSWAVRNASMQLFGKTFNTFTARVNDGVLWGGSNFYVCGQNPME